MKSAKSKIRCGGMSAILVLALGLMVRLSGVSEAAPMGTAFTYQGRLMDANRPADGLYDFQFKLYDDANTITGNQVGGDVSKPDVDVIDGYFTAELDFGGDPNIFNGDTRWLEIHVRIGDSNDPNAYSTLIPRQELTPTPYASYAKTAGSVAGGIVGSGTVDYIAKFTDSNTLGSSSIYESAGNVGIGTRYPNFRLTLNDDGGIYAKGSFGSGVSFGSTGVGSRLIWYPRKAAFRAGYVDGSQWSNFNIGDYSTATGYNTEASDDYSTAMGYNTRASGDYSTAMGYSTIASGRKSTAMGKESHAWGNQSTAIGTDTYARGLSSVAMGTGATSEGHFSTAIGTDTSASGYASTAMGWYATSSGDDSIAIGKYITADANNSIVLGSGVSNSNCLINDTENSLIVGFGISPTLFVDGATVGIGTTNPDRNLDIRHSNTGGGIEIDRSANTIWSGLVYENNGAENWFIGVQANSDNLLFKDNAAGISIAVEDGTGNVGIGTTSPGAKLDVEGYIQTQDNLPFSIRRYTGTLGTIGSRTFAHGITNGHHKGLIVQAWCKGNTNEMIPMDIEYMDGGQIRIINGIANRPYRVTIIHTSSDHVW